MHEVQDQGATWLFCLQNIIDRLRAAAFQAAAWVYPGALPYISSTDYTRLLGYLVWFTLISYRFQRTMLAPFLECDGDHTYSHHARKEKASFPIMFAAQDAHNFWLFNCNYPIEYLPLPAKHSISFSTLLPCSCDETKPSVTVNEWTHAHASLVVVLSPLF